MVAQKSEVRVLVDGAGDQAGDCGGLFGAHRGERVVAPDEGVGGCVGGDALEVWEEDAAGVCAGCALEVGAITRISRGTFNADDHISDMISVKRRLARYRVPTKPRMIDIL